MKYWPFIQHISVFLGFAFALGTVIILSTLALELEIEGGDVLQQKPYWAIGFFGFSTFTISVTGFLMARFIKLARLGQGFSSTSIKVLKVIAFLLFIYHVGHLVQPSTETIVSLTEAGVLTVQRPGSDVDRYVISLSDLMGVYTAFLLTLIVSLMGRAHQLEKENKQFI